MRASLKQDIEKLANLDLKNYGADFLATWEKNDSEVAATILTAQILRDLYQEGISAKVFDSGLAVSIFKDKSTRTRYSYTSAANFLGLETEELDEGKSQITHGETVMETANMVSYFTRAIGIRDDIYLGVGQKYMKQVARALDWGYKNKVLRYRPSVINLQSDEDHSTQSLSDLMHLINYFGGIDKLKDKKVAISWAYSPSYGKPLSVPQGAISLFSRFGMDITLAYPNGYNLIPRIEKLSAVQSKKSGGKFKILHNMSDAFKGADVVYPKSWASFEIMQKRTKFLRKGDQNAAEKLEGEALAQNAKYKNWTCTEKLMKLNKNKKVLYMHCLPADISGVSCKEGEVEKSVFERFKKETYIQASYKPNVIAAMILLGQYGGNTPEVIRKLV